jgi:hypothetical protein
MKCPTCGHDHKGMMRLPKDIPLLPCPCCGGKAEFDDYDVENGEVLVRCVDCDLNTVPRSHEEAAAQWNRRPNARLQGFAEAHTLQGVVRSSDSEDTCQQ